MYPKVKVKEQREEANQYDYEKSSLQSLKAFEWLSLHNSDDYTGSVVRVPRSYTPKSPTPGFLTSKETKKTGVEENQKNVRANSAPRPRAILSSPDNDEIIRTRTKARRQLFPGLKNRDSSQNKHTQCKIFPKSAAVESFAHTQGHYNESGDPKNDTRAKSRATAPVNSRTRLGGLWKKTTSSSIQS